jgi:hypothetical protein
MTILQKEPLNILQKQPFNISQYLDDKNSHSQVYNNILTKYTIKACLSNIHWHFINVLFQRREFPEKRTRLRLTKLYTCS